MPKIVTMLGDDLPSQQDLAALNRGGDLIWPGGLALVSYLGLRLSGFKGSVLWLGPIAGAVLGWKMAKAQRVNLADVETA